MQARREVKTHTALGEKAAIGLAGQVALEEAMLGEHLLLICLMAVMGKHVGLESWTSWGWVMLWIWTPDCSFNEQFLL